MDSRPSLSLSVSTTYKGETFDSPYAAVNKAVSDFKADFDLVAGRISEMMLQTLNDIFAQLKYMHGQQWPLNDSTFGTSSKNLAMRSGGGLDSIQRTITVRTASSATGFSVEGSISTGLLTVHETGVTITANRAKYLTIPLRAALDSRGLPLRARARDWQNTFVRASKGRLYIFRRDGKNIVPLYLLKQSVYIPPRLHMADTVSQYADMFYWQLEREFTKGFVA